LIAWVDLREKSGQSSKSGNGTSLDCVPETSVVQQIGNFAKIGQGIEVSIVERSVFRISSPHFTEQLVLVVVIGS
jgi:hypothetical protein